MKRIIVLTVLSLVSSAAASDKGMSPEAVTKRLTTCLTATELTPDDVLKPIGVIKSVEQIGTRLPKDVLHVIGTKARGYALFNADGTCGLIAVVGKPEAYLKGKLGGKATVAYALRGGDCGVRCMMAVSVKTADDKLLDVLPLPADCEDHTEMAKLAAFPGRDSIKVGCWRTGGADKTRHDLFIDFDGTSLALAASNEAGTAWIQLEEGKAPTCTAKPPGEMVVAKKGAEPQLDVSGPATPEQGAAAKVEIVSPGGCETTIATRRMTYDPKARRFVATGTPALSVRKKLCVCKK